VLAVPAFGDVIEIAPGGAVTVYREPSVFNSRGVSQIQAGPQMWLRRASPPIPPPGLVESTILSAAKRYSIDPTLLTGLAWQESHFRHDAISPKGAVGVMQLMAGTARDLGVDRYDFSQNILGGAAYLRQMLDRYGDASLALAAYNAGPSAIDRYRGIPPFRETKTYVESVMGSISPPFQQRRPFVISVYP
jgi:soluble lytic murein transglycosylase-like protein